MTHAEFRQFCTPGTGPGMGSVTCIPFIWTHTWNKDKADFTTSNVKYDVNGNLLSMKERCTLAGAGGTPADMDDLTYGYASNSNRLESVTDAVAPDYNLGEFTDVFSACGTSPTEKPGAAGSIAGARPTSVNGRTTAVRGREYSGGDVAVDGREYVPGPPPPPPPGTIPCPDYDYDADGNLIKDENKHITSIVYNEGDLPLEVNFAGGSKITNTYTANGTLIRKVIHDVTATADEVYRYWGGFVYKGDGVGTDKLQYVLHAEGRARYTAATNLFTYDYFVKDHLGNVRSIVTGNVTNVSGGGGTTAVSLLRTYLATHEISLGALEGAIFMNLANVRFNKPIAVTSTDVKAAKLNGADPNRRVGTAIMLKVMAGDRFDLSAKSFWVGNPCAPTTSSSNMASAMLGVLTGAQSSLGMAEGTGAQLVADAISPSNYAAYQSILNTLSNPFAPRAYINYMVFDEKMNLLPLQSGAIQVSAIQGSWRNMAMALPLKIQKNGYLTVSVSNASNTDVFIDNIKIDVYQGNLLNEQHYYPFGLAINEGDAAGVPKNKFKYQGKEITEALDLQLYDFGPRQYDPQLGRFWGVDPASQFPSGYAGMGNDPANMIDPTGCYANTSSTLAGGNYSSRYSGAMSGDICNPFGIGSIDIAYNIVGWGEDKMLFAATMAGSWVDIPDELKPEKFREKKHQSKIGTFKKEISRVQQIDSKNKTGISKRGKYISMQAMFHVSDVKAERLQAIQIYMGSRFVNDDGKVLPLGTGHVTIEGVTYDLAIDGGKFMPPGQESEPGKPYYMGEDGKKMLVWDGANGSITFTDQTSVSPNVKTAIFETAIVAVNYNGTGKDKVLGVFFWGWGNHGQFLIETTQFLRTNFTDRAKTILNREYSDYKYD